MNPTAIFARTVACALAISGSTATWGQTSPAPGTDTGTSGQFEQKVHTFSTIGQGVAIGAIAGGALGYLAGGRSGKSAAIGAGVGGVVGGVFGTLVAKSQKAFASKEDQLKQLNANAQKQNADLDGIVESARAMLASDRAQILALQGQLVDAHGNATAASYAMKTQAVQKLQHDLALYDQAIAASDKRLEGSRQALADYRKKYPNDQDAPGVVEVASNIDAFEQKSSELKSVRNDHAILLASLDGTAAAR